MSTFVPSQPNHPIHPMPMPEQLAQMGAKKAAQYLTLREQLLVLERKDPFNYGYEPPMWKVCDALLGFHWVPEAEAASIRERLGFPAPVSWLLILGGNRAGKTEYATKRCMRILMANPDRRAWIFHTTNPMSIEYHQPLIHKFLPPELRVKKLKTETAYLSYTMQNGFSEGRFVLPNGSTGSFRNYAQDISTIEGGEVDFIHDDELVPMDWVETQDLRLATRGGKGIITFTPVDGYTTTVSAFVDGGIAALESPCHLIKTDGTQPNVSAAIAEGRQDPLRDQPDSIPGVPRVPRIIRSTNPNRAVVYFHSSDNPYGNPGEVAKRVLQRGENYIKERFYGIATKNWSARFSVSDKVHVVPPSHIPQRGNNTMACDPSSARNWFMLWMRATPAGAYIYREWPSQVIPVTGGGPVLGPWSVPDGRHIDGVPGPGSRTLGFGLSRYKEEIARLEGWADADREDTDARHWRETNGSRERVFRRVIDSRFASAPRLENDRPKTLITDMEEIGLWFEPAAGIDIEEGVQLIVNTLYYDPAKPLEFGNIPQLCISSECKNLLFSLKTWTGVDGNKGASKDPIDTLRYLLLANSHQWSPPVGSSGGNGYY